VAAVLVAGCGDSVSHHTYGSSWAKSAGATLCSEWLGDVDSKSRLGLANAMLNAIEYRGRYDFPPGTRVRDLEADISAACERKPGSAVADAGVVVVAADLARDLVNAGSPTPATVITSDTWAPIANHHASRASVLLAFMCS
jgi:hypothetical protein